MRKLPTSMVDSLRIGRTENEPMDLIAIFKAVSSGDIALAIVLFLSAVQIAPIKITPWTWLAKWFGRAINSEVIKRQDELEKKFDERQDEFEKKLDGVHEELDNLKEREEIKEADAMRNRILRFADELRQHMRHSKEYFEQVLSEIDTYLAFCRSNDDYPNSKADAAIKYTLECYEKVLKEDDFT